MARVIQDYQPAYRRDELNFHRFDRCFANHPHNIYAVYDPVEDQLIVRVVDPKIFASEYFVADYIALLITEDREVVGFSVSQFQSEFLLREPELRRTWASEELGSKLSQYTQLRYRPRKNQTGPLSQRVVAYSAYQSKAAATLLAA